jgi:hypothetical protein
VYAGGFRVGVGSDDEHGGQGRGPFLQLGDEPCPTGHERAGIGLLLHLGQDLTFLQRDRFVVADQSPVQGELQECRLAADGGEHRLAADPGPGGHEVDGRCGPPELDEQVAGRVDDRSAGRPRLALPQRRPVRTACL